MNQFWHRLGSNININKHTAKINKSINLSKCTHLNERQICPIFLIISSFYAHRTSCETIPRYSFLIKKINKMTQSESERLDIVSFF